MDQQQLLSPVKKRVSSWLRLLPVTIVAVTVLFFLRVHNVFHSHLKVLPENAIAAAAESKEKKEDPLDPDIQKKVFARQNTSVTKRPMEFDSAQIDILQSLGKRRKVLDEFKRTLDAREAGVLIAEQKVSQKLLELTKLREALDKKLGIMDEKEAKKMENLSKMYQSMKPQEAAAIFNKLEMEITLAVLGKMSPIKSSAILAKMDPDKAREVTSAIAEGTASAPKEKEIKDKINS